VPDERVRARQHAGSQDAVYASVSVQRGQDRPNTTGLDPNLPGDQQTAARWFNTDAFVLQSAGTFGNAGRNTFFGPGIFSVDASIIRNFRIMRTRTLQLRLEGFNVLNQPIWNDPNTQVTNPLYGSITSTRKPMQHKSTTLVRHSVKEVGSCSRSYS
jgi:hypothetical protein